MKRQPIIIFDDYDGGCRYMYEFITKPRERTSAGARQIWRQKKDRGFNGPYDKVMGFVFYGENDGHTAVMKADKNPVPYEYSKDKGKTWILAQTEDTIKHTYGEFSPKLKYGDRYFKTNRVENGFSRVENKQHKFNFIDKDGTELTTTWFDGASDFTDVNGEVIAEIVYKGNQLYLSKDAQIYEELNDEYPLCHANELPGIIA
jgi:hypothetical protein